MRPAFVSCLAGLERMLAKELAALPVRVEHVTHGGVQVSATDADLHRVLRVSGLVTHVLLRLTPAPVACRALGELERKVREMPWREWLRGRGALRVTATAHASRVFHTGAIVERVCRAAGIDSAPDAEATLLCRFDRDAFTLSLNTNREPLHRRGWRLATGKAPLREDIAWALVQASGWDPAREALVDPFCGSGTVAIEASAWAHGLEPGRLRFPRVGVADDPYPEAAVHASDRDAGVMELARSNAERAGVASRVAFANVAFSAHPLLAPSSTAPLVVVTNPPYGHRVDTSRALYQQLGNLVRAQPATRRLAFVCSDPKLAHCVGVPLERVLSVSHGGIRVGVYRTKAKD